MGSNGSYNKKANGVPRSKRSHIDTRMRIDGHKVLLQSSNRNKAKNILYSNSDSPIYIIGKRNKDGSIDIHSVNVFKGHKLEVEINLKYNKDGTIRSYDGSEGSSHCHYWEEKATGSMRRKETANAHETIPQQYVSLLNDIVKFNRQNRIYHDRRKKNSN